MENPYASPKASESPARRPREYVVPIDGVSGRVSVTSASGLFSAGALLLDGQPPEKVGRQGYRLPLRDGTTAMAQLRTSWTRPAPSVIVNGRTYEVGSKIGWGYLVLMFLPFALVPVGGLIGGLFGGIGVTVNRMVAFSARPWWLRVPVMVGVTLVAIASYLLVAGLLFGHKGSP